jgi:hypothetical protein
LQEFSLVETDAVRDRQTTIIFFQQPGRDAESPYVMKRAPSTGAGYGHPDLLAQRCGRCVATNSSRVTRKAGDAGNHRCIGEFAQGGGASMCA